MRRLAWLAALLLPGVAQASCFEGQLPQAEWAAAAAASALRLLVTQPGGKVSATASGVVVASSGAPNRVLTAGQVVRDAAAVPDSWIAAWSSSGRYLGRMEAAAAEASQRPAPRLSAQVTPSGVRAGDVAVLRMTQLSADGARLYGAIPGLPLAPRQPVGILAATVSDPAGLDLGAAGAGVIGENGGLLGVALPRAVGRAAPRADVQVGDAGGGRSRSVRLPLSAAAYAMPLSDPAILTALGHAGAGVAQARGPLRQRATILGYAGGGCVVFRAAMAPP